MLTFTKVIYIFMLYFCIFENVARHMLHKHILIFFLYKNHKNKCEKKRKALVGSYF